MNAHLESAGDDVNTVILSGIENCAGVTSACLPTMLPIWNYLRHGRARPSLKHSLFDQTSGRQGSAKSSSMKTTFWTGSGKHDAVASKHNGTFQRLSDDRTDELDDLQPPVRPSRAITITTNIETFQNTPSMGRSISSTVGARQREW